MRNLVFEDQRRFLRPIHFVDFVNGGFAFRLGQMNFIFAKVGSNAGKSGHFSRVLQENTLIVGNIFHNSFENVHLTQSVCLTYPTAVLLPISMLALA